ncbi:MAG: hypothetical protein ACRED3_18820 [Bradyrhizobium sp.]
MSTDKLQALHNTVANILSEPASPPTFFDEEPHDAAQGRAQAAKGSDNLRARTEAPKENFGKLGISANEIQEAIVRDARNDSVGIARQAFAEQTPIASPADSGNQRFSRLSHQTASVRPDSQTASNDTFRSIASGDGISLGRWALRGVAGILLAAGIGVGAVIWLGSSGDAAKTAPSQPAALAQAAPTAAVSPEVTPLLQSMARDLASMGKEIEQLKAGRDLMARDNANLSEQLKASQEQLTRTVARLSEQLKASQEQAARDNANVADQVRGLREQLTSVMSRVSEPNAPPRIAARPRPTLPSPQPAGPAARPPGPTVSTAQPAARPRAEKPKPSPSPTPRPPAPAR